MKLFLALFLAGLALVSEAAPRPVVMWHGMGDTCCNPFSLGYVQKLIEQHIPGIYVHSLEIGSGQIEDEFNGFFMPIAEQIPYAFNQIMSVPQLQAGFNALGFSQGGQFLRAFVQQYNYPPVHNLITLGAQHQGVYGMPRCPGANSTLCELARKLLDVGAYVPFVQKRLVQAEYWHDAINENNYVEHNIWLPGMNNEVNQNQTYKENLMSLNAFVMVQFTEDTMVQPRSSEYFGFYAPGQDKVEVSLQQTELYQQDWLGLQQMDQSNKLHFIPCVGDHLQFSDEWFVNNIIPFLSN
jgi:palmitoyl-protein thioesterase